MQFIEKYIRGLLFQHDCVIVPGLGGFIMHNKSAAIDTIRHRFYPPSRMVSFNALIRSDDGLLINAISVGEQLSYESAKTEVERYVSQLLLKLNHHEKLIIEQVGTLSSSTDGLMTFEPDLTQNYLDASFGLNSFISSPVKRDESVKRLEKKIVDRVQRVPHAPLPKPVRATLIFAVPMIIFLLWGIISPQKIHEAYSNASLFITVLLRNQPVNLEVRTTDDGQVNKISTIISTPVDASKELQDEILPSHPLAEPVISQVEDIPGTGATGLTQTAELSDEVELNVITSTPGLAKYYIIGGCFQSMDNAKSFMHELIVKGYQPELPGTNLRGHFRVSYYSYNDKSDALSSLEYIRGGENPAAWLLKY